MASFKVKSPDEIARASRIAELKSQSSYNDKSGGEAWTCAFAPDESYFAWSKGNRIVVLVPWNAKKSRPVLEDEVLLEEKLVAASEGKSLSSPPPPPLTIDCGYLVWAVAISRNGHRGGDGSPFRIPLRSEGELILATGLGNSRVRIYDVPSGKLLMELIDHKDVIRDIKFSPDDSLRLVSASRDMTLKVWDLRDGGNMFKTLNGHHKWVFACDWSPDARYLVSVGSKNQALLWNMETYALHRKLEGHEHDVVACHFSPDGAILATASLDTRVFLWDPDTGRKLRTLGHLHPPPSLIYAGGTNESWVRGASFNPDGCHFASVADDGYVRIWNLFEGEDPEEIAVLPDSLCCAFSPSGRTLAVGTRNGCVTFFASPVRVLSLLQLCRLSIRKRLASTAVPQLEVPRTLHRYLEYKDW